MSIRDELYYRLQSPVLADWLDEQRPTSWWSVDGDPLLTERLNFPCPAADLANELRRIGKSLLIFAPHSLQDREARHEIIATDLNDLASVESTNDRVFQLCWEDAGPEIDWVLAEDTEAGESSSSSSSSSASDQV